MTSRFKFLAASFSYLSAIFPRRDTPLACFEDDEDAKFEQQPTISRHSKRSEIEKRKRLKDRIVHSSYPEQESEQHNDGTEILSQLRSFITELEEKESFSKLRMEKPCKSTSISEENFANCSNANGVSQSLNLNDGISEIFRKELTDHSPTRQRNLSITTEVYSSSDYEEFESDVDYQEDVGLEAIHEAVASLNASLSKPSNSDISRLLELSDRAPISRWGSHPYRHRIRLNRNLRDQERERGNVVNDGNEVIYLRSPAANPPLAELLRNIEDAQDFLNGQGDNHEREICIQNVYDRLRPQPDNIIVSVNFSRPMKFMTFFLAINTFILLKVVFWESLLMLF